MHSGVLTSIVSTWLISQAYMILLRKKKDADEVKDFRPINLIHSISKLITKTLSRRIAPYLLDMVQPNQSAFINGRAIHDNFMAFQSTVRLLHVRQQPSVLLKIDIAKAFDTVSWPLLL
jgi:hypothetical protein